MTATAAAEQRGDGDATTSAAMRDRLDRWIAAGIVAGLLAVVAARTALLGWLPIAPDDARYLFVGLSIFAGDGPITPGGNLFLLRAPVYGVLLASGSLVLGGDPVVGARAVAIGIAVLSLLGAMRVGWLLGGVGAAIGTGAALLAMPLVWRLLPSLRVDLPQTAGVVAVLIALWRPTPGRWALAGALFGLTVLVKETVLPLAALPLVLVGLEPPRRLLRLWAIYLTCAAAVAGWWWIVVWIQAGVIFPANAFGVIEARDVAADVRLDRSTFLMLGAITLAWGVAATLARRDRGARLLVGAAVGLAPAAIYATIQGLNARNYVGLAVLSSIALGLAIATLAPALGRRIIGEFHGSRRRLPFAAGALGFVALLGLGAAWGQASAGRPAADELSDELVGWLQDHTDDGDRIAMTFRDRELVALRLFGSVEAAGLPVRRVDPSDDLAEYVWLGLRDDQLFGYRRASWQRTLDEPTTRFLVLSGPHAFTPDALLPALDSGTTPGLHPIMTLEDGDERADVFAVHPGEVQSTPVDLPLHLSPQAAMAWLDLASGQGAEDAAIDRLAGAHSVVVGADASVLLDRLGSRVCVVPHGPEGAQIGPAGAPCPG